MGEFEKGIPFGSLESDEPAEPILSMRELPNAYDLRDSLPPGIRAELSEDDMVVEVFTPEISSSRRYPSAIREMTRLAGVNRLQDIGKNGAAVASLASQENSHVEALRKFEVIHGRDALRIALDLHSQFPRLLQSTILALAETQGLENEIFNPNQPFRQEEKGRIMLLHRQPDDPMGRKFSKYLNWGWPFYGSIDATPSFISAIHKASQSDKAFLEKKYIAKDGTPSTVSQAFDHSVEWLLRKLDENEEGILEFQNTDPKGGISAQSWKDSAFSYVHADGSRANHKDGIASIEVQALAYDALCDAAMHYSANGRPNVVGSLLEQAVQLREQIFSSFWVDDSEKGGYFALATDRDKSGKLRQLKVRTSNMGHLLSSSLLNDTTNESVRLKRDAIVKQIFSPKLLHFSGIRTLASDENAFRPGGYHTGSVWLWDTARIADGLEKQQFHHLAWELRKRIWQTIETTRQFPEFVRGEKGDNVSLNPSEVYVWNKTHQVLHLFEQPPQEIQGWTVSALLATKYAYPAYLKHRHSLPSSSLEQEILEKMHGKAA